MMIEVLAERTVAAPPEAVWSLVSDPARMPEWFGFAERVEVLEGADGPGQRRRQHGHWGRKPSEVDQRITRWDPRGALAWTHEAERLDGKPAPRFAASTDFSIELAPADGGTHVRLHSRQQAASRPRGLVMRLFGERDLRKTLERSLDALAAASR